MKGSKPIILLDMDDVLAQCMQRLIELVNERFSLSIKKEEVRDFYLEKEVQRIRPELTWQEICAPLREPDFFRNLDIMDGAQEGVERLSKLGEVVIVTSTPVALTGANAFTDKFLWLEANFPSRFTEKDIIFTKRKELVTGDVLIDDAPHNVAVYPGKAIIFSAPWNRHLFGRPRAENWEELPDLCSKVLDLRR